MKNKILINKHFALAGFTSGNEGIWTRNEPYAPPTSDYTELSRKLNISLSRIIRPYQANGDKVEIVSSEHGGFGVIKDNTLQKVDGLVTAEKGIVISIIAADCVPVYLIDEKASVIGLLHCGWKSAAGELIHNAIDKMQFAGVSPSEILMLIGPHICANCYEVGQNVYEEYKKAFTEKELENIFSVQDSRLYLNMAEAIRIKTVTEGIPNTNITYTNDCTYHNSDYYSYRRGDRGKQNLAYIMMKER